jgi:hypothetical protein
MEIYFHSHVRFHGTSLGTGTASLFVYTKGRRFLHVVYRINFDMSLLHPEIICLVAYIKKNKAMMRTRRCVTSLHIKGTGRKYKHVHGACMDQCWGGGGLDPRITAVGTALLS